MAKKGGCQKLCLACVAKSVSDVNSSNNATNYHHKDSTINLQKAMGSQNNQSTLAKFAFNIYGNLNSGSSLESTPMSVNPSFNSLKSKSSDTKDKIHYQCDREVTSLTQLNSSITIPSYHSAHLSNHVVIGGKNYLQLLVLNEDQTRIVHDINILQHHSYMRSSSSKLNNINTVKAHHDTVLCGMSNGFVSIYKISPTGKSTLTHKLSDHKRTVNSVDFVGHLNHYESPQQIISGSQDGAIKLWDLRSSSLKPMLTLQPSSHSDPLRSCQYSPHNPTRNKTTVLSVHDSGALCKSDLRSGHGTERKWNIHTGPALSLHIHPEREYVITGGRDQKMCVWNYGDSAPGTSRLSTEHMISTYSPVMKVRWSNYTLLHQEIVSEFQQSSEFTRYEDSLSYDERESLLSTPNGNSLYNYDFACSYLNDDATISIYNLNRKFIPKEIITTPSNKSFQNFIWARCSNKSRKIWTITKSNAFTTYDLDVPNQPEITNPLNDLTTVSFAWKNGIGDFSFVNQEKYEYELTDNESVAQDQEHDDSDHGFSFENTPIEESKSLDLPSMNYPIPVKPISGSIPVAINHVYNSSSMSHSPIEKPFLHRSFTHNPLQNTKSPSPVPQRRGSNVFGDMGTSFRGGHTLINASDPSFRPKLSRNPSQTTVESNGSYGSPIPSSAASHRKLVAVNHASPYVIPISLPLPLNDESVFETLALSYLRTIPDGFDLIDVCQINSGVAESANRLRDRQIWQMLAVSLSEEVDITNQDLIDADVVEDLKSPIDEREVKESVFSKSISSELDNFASSYNSNSTSQTNYGTAVTAEHGTSTESLVPDAPRQLHVVTSHDPSINLKELINSSRGNSFSTNLSPTTSKAMSSIMRNKHYQEENENAIIEDTDDQKSRAQSFASPRLKQGRVETTSPIKIQADKDQFETVIESYSPRTSFSSSKRPLVRSYTAEDLDNENFNVLNNAVMHSHSSGLSVPRSTGSSRYAGYMSHKGSAGSGSLPTSSLRRNSFLHRTESVHSSEHKRLKDVEERPEDATSEVPPSIHTTSELTRAINKNAQNKKNLLKPWKIQNLLCQALEYAENQGDIVLSATLVLLFYERVTGVVSFNSALNLLGLYIEILQQKRLFSIAIAVLNESPRPILDELKKVSHSEIDLRFFCCMCQKLLVNEKSKNAIPTKHSEFGYWYCDICSKIQSNCIYCNEPCKGLNVVVSLKCGHRGHFGCLREWFICEENVECPGGCDYSVI